MNVKAPELLQLGKAIRRFREERGYSQDKFAYEVNLGRSYYGSLERGEINPSILTLIKITRALDIELGVVMPKTLN
jgi:transcriptional regulator with XRE-family HTH domain